VVVLIALVAACGTSDEGLLYATSAVTASGNGGADSASVAQGSGGNAGVGGSLSVVGAGGSACEPTCSGDLKTVVGCNGEVLKQCPGDQACTNGACTDDPCGAAEAAKSSYGCDYWAVKPDVIANVKGGCFAAFVANTWSSPVHIDVLRGGTKLDGTGFLVIPSGQGDSITYQPYDAVKGLPPGEVAIAFLAHESPSPTSVPACPVPAAVNAEVGVKGTGLGEAFHIKTDRPVVAYSILPYGGGPSAATSASLLLLTSARDTNYVALNAYRQSTISAAAGAAPSLDILGKEDGTEVTILPKVAIVPGSGVDGSSPNVPVTYKLAAGQYLQITQPTELTGSPIQSNKPVGIWGGSTCLNVLPHEAACDSAHQQTPPVKALGSEYALVRYRNRKAAKGEETPPWRLVGAVDGTKLTWKPSTPPGAPKTLTKGQVYEFIGSGPYVVASQDDGHPLYLAQYMTGATHLGPTSSEGDPEWVNVVPTAQYQSDDVFFTDPTYPETSLVVVRRRSPNTKAFVDVTLDCLGPVTGWQPVGDADGDMSTRASISSPAITPRSAIAPTGATP
jgi:hypothetical protein